MKIEEVVCYRIACDHCGQKSQPYTLDELRGVNINIIARVINDEGWDQTTDGSALVLCDRCANALWDKNRKAFE